MGTLVKEEFGRPNRENTMVFSKLYYSFLFSSHKANILITFPCRECTMGHMIN